MPSKRYQQLTLFEIQNSPAPVEPNQLEFLLLEEIKNNPGITTSELCDRFKMSPADVVPILRHRLLKKGKIKDLGWSVADDVSLRHDTQPDSNMSLRHDSSPIDDQGVSLHHDKITGDRLDGVSLHHDKESSIDASLRHDKFTDKPRVVWLRPGGRETAYPWFQCGKKRTYIGGGPIGSSVAESRVATVRAWIDEGIAPSEICDRIKSLKSGQVW